MADGHFSHKGHASSSQLLPSRPSPRYDMIVALAI